MAKKYLFVWAAILTVVPHLASAQLLMDQTMGAMTGLGAQVNTASRAGTSDQVVMQRLKAMHYTNVQKDPSTPNQYIAVAPEGMRVRLTVNSATGQIISAMPY